MFEAPKNEGQWASLFRYRRISVKKTRPSFQRACRPLACRVFALLGAKLCCAYSDSHSDSTVANRTWLDWRTRRGDPHYRVQVELDTQINQKRPLQNAQNLCFFGVSPSPKCDIKHDRVLLRGLESSGSQKYVRIVKKHTVPFFYVGLMCFLMGRWRKSKMTPGSPRCPFSSATAASRTKTRSNCTGSTRTLRASSSVTRATRWSSAIAPITTCPTCVST